MSRFTPTDIAPSDDELRLRIEWGDGHVSEYEPLLLRQRCPCARCVEEMTGRALLDPDSVDPGVYPLAIEHAMWALLDARGFKEEDFARSHPGGALGRKLLVLVRDLCGTFCFSMQFVVFMELAGTLVLPAAISFTIYLIVISAVNGGQQTMIPLILLGIILGLPGLLIVVTSRKIAYVGWMFIYLLSLPIWNFVLPTYAFWHFDDFSWGQTRRVSGDKGGNHGDKEGEFDSTHIVMKRWAEFERERRWRGGTQSRDSTFYDVKSNSPKRYVLINMHSFVF